LLAKYKRGSEENTKTKTGNIKGLHCVQMSIAM
jgi:hypothetical protein